MAEIEFKFKINDIKTVADKWISLKDEKQSFKLKDASSLSGAASDLECVYDVLPQPQDPATEIPTGLSENYLLTFDLITFQWCLVHPVLALSPTDKAISDITDKAVIYDYFTRSFYNPTRLDPKDLGGFPYVYFIPYNKLNISATTNDTNTYTVSLDPQTWTLSDNTIQYKWGEDKSFLLDPVTHSWLAPPPQEQDPVKVNIVIKDLEKENQNLDSAQNQIKDLIDGLVTQQDAEQIKQGIQGLEKMFESMLSNNKKKNTQTMNSELDKTVNGFLEQKDGQIKILNERIETILKENGDIGQLKKELEELNKLLSKLRTTNEGLQTELNTQLKNINALSKNANVKDTKTKYLEDQIAQLTQKITDQQNEITRLESSTEKDKQIQELENELKIQKERADKLANENNTQKQKFDAQMSEYLKQKTLIELSKNKNENTTSNIELEKQIIELQKQIKTQQNVQKDSDTLQTKLQDLENLVEQYKIDLSECKSKLDECNSTPIEFRDLANEIQKKAKDLGFSMNSKNKKLTNDQMIVKLNELTAYLYTLNNMIRVSMQKEVYNYIDPFQDLIRKANFEINTETISVVLSHAVTFKNQSLFHDVANALKIGKFEFSYAGMIEISKSKYRLTSDQISEIKKSIKNNSFRIKY